MMLVFLSAIKNNFLCLIDSMSNRITYTQEAETPAVGGRKSITSRGEHVSKQLIDPQLIWVCPPRGLPLLSLESNFIHAYRLLIKIKNNQTPFQMSTHIPAKAVLLTQIGRPNISIKSENAPMSCELLFILMSERFPAPSSPFSRQQEASESAPLSATANYIDDLEG
jgi:hypothetical protein